MACAGISGQILASLSYAPPSGGTLTTTSSTLAAMSSGVVCTGPFKAPPSGKVIIDVKFVSNSSASVAVGFALAAVGTVSPVAGLVTTLQQASANPYTQINLPFLISGLTPGQTYNYDVLFGTASGTLTVIALGQSSTTVAAGNKGGPIVITVRGV